MRLIKMYEEFLEDKHSNHYPYISAKMKELSDLVNDILKREYEPTAKFEYALDDDELEITLVMDSKHEVVEDEFIHAKVLTILFDLDTMLIGTYFGHEEDFRVRSVEEGMDLIEKKIYDTLGISEKKKN